MSAYRQVLVQSKGPCSLGTGPRLQTRRIQSAGLVPVHGERLCIGCQRHIRFPVMLMKAAAQAFMAGHQRTQAALQRLTVQAPLQVQRHRNVVRSTGFSHLGQEPQALLGQGKRQAPFTRHRFQGRQGLHAGLQAGRHRSQAVVGEQVGQRQFAAHLFAYLGQHAHGQQGVPALLEETVLPADGVEPKQIGPDSRQVSLMPSPRGFEHHRRQILQPRGRQRRTINLAVVVQRHPRQGHERRRHHVVGQSGAQVIAQRRAIEVLATARVPGDQSVGPVGLLHGHHQHLADAGCLSQHLLDFARLDTETADFHLIIVAPQAFELAVGIPAHQVARAIKTRPRLLAERVLDKALLGQVGPIQVTQGHTVTAHIQFTDHAPWHRALPRIEHIHLGIADGTTNGDLVCIRR
ncbi:hypothetical protein EDP1_4133 [Pseudomonas putida S610]|nr:hypothetical protein EDP1_4133 [Pseudomonas putida S610]